MRITFDPAIYSQYYVVLVINKVKLHVKVCDLGLAAIFRDTCTFEDKMGTPGHGTLPKQIDLQIQDSFY